jgi:uncharacterized protein (DUF2141 family)
MHTKRKNLLAFPLSELCEKLCALCVILFLFNCTSGEIIYQPKETQAELRIVIKNVRSEGGNVNFVLFDSKENFMKTEKAVVAGIRKAIVPESAFVISGKLMPGTYAAVAFHDENGNGKLDTHKSGLPKEGFGASKETKALGVPKWEDCFFEVKEVKTIVNVNLIYP